jgi:hypothetical protein
MKNLESSPLLVISFMLKNFEVVPFVLGLSYDFLYDFLYDFV